VSIAVLLADRREHDLTRWHSRLMLQPRESLMCHEGSVARIGLIIALALRHYAIAEPDIEAVLAGALAHDVAECLTGDSPGGHLKTKHPTFKEALAEIEREAETVIYSGLPESMAEYMTAAARRKDEDSLEGQIIEYADKLDAYNFACVETMLGHVMLEPGAPPQTSLAAINKMHWPWLMKLRAATGGLELSQDDEQWRHGGVS
jgi:5'-deoxynucleotidase YfbR-like HD superfamily hydrolase